MDKYDNKILFYLDENARIPYTELSKKVKLNKDTIKYRINNYLNNNILEGFYSLINSAKLGFYSFRIYFSFTNTNSKEEQEIIKQLKRNKNIFYIVEVEGNFNIAFGYFAKSILEFNNFIKKLNNNKIEIKQKTIFTELQHFDRNYLINKQRLQLAKTIIQEPKETKLDKTDIKLLQILSNNARIQIIELSKQLNLTSKAIIYRIKKLKDNNILLGFKPKINLEKLNYSMYKIDLEIKNQETKDKIKQFISQLPNIIHYEETFNNNNLEFDLECKNYEEFQLIINQIKEIHGNEIEKINHYRSIKIHKTIYMPNI